MILKDKSEYTRQLEQQIQKHRKSQDHQEELEHNSYMYRTGNAALQQGQSNSCNLVIFCTYISNSVKHLNSHDYFLKVQFSGLKKHTFS